MSIAVKDIPLFQGLSEGDLEQVKKCLIERSFEKGQTLFFEGKTCERDFIIKSGKVKLYRTSSSGREQVLETLGPGDTCACNPGLPTWSCSSTAQAMAPSQVWFLSRDDYIRMVKTNSKVSHALNKLFAERLSRFSSLIEEVSLKDTKKRLIKFLLDMLGDKTFQAQQKAALLLPFTREELAQRMGMARETVARQLYQLKRAKLIDIKPHEIIVRNKEGLEKLLL